MNKTNKTLSLFPTSVAIFSFVLILFLLFSIQTPYAQDNPDLNRLVDISTPHVKAHGVEAENIKKGKEVLHRTLKQLGFEKWKKPFDSRNRGDRYLGQKRPMVAF